MPGRVCRPGRRCARAESWHPANPFTEWRPGYAPWQCGTPWQAATGELDVGLYEKLASI